ncbi:YkgJ family cysteine cluster protein [Pseudoxanthomonas koreensis]|uniref:YkgJ family cysteine cluster protein n=1 Tax=Pseudoxanthomonas koreensis TaxID=266061 RepID=UPI0013912CDF|nr:YkgJ family cysteine cluster protein [Pseudoxanthomonas koreensis]KAF1689630.1 zinc/iron-chelating domain-containing protein [Pseudoxanthomonas koreensis]
MHPCLTCGACCTQYRVAFHWMESDASTPGGVPAALTEPLDRHRLCMRGTRDLPVQCVALDAEIGVRSRCSIHPQRPSVCREVDASWENGVASRQCEQARLAHGLPALTLADWRWRDPADNDDGCPDDNGNDNSPSSPPTPTPIAA